MNNLHVRRANPGDIPKLLDLLRQDGSVHAEGRPDLFKKGKTKYSAEELGLILRDETRPVFVAADQEDCVRGCGFCIITETGGSNILQEVKELYIDDICVDQHSRGTGCGSIIFEAIEAYARDIGCYHLMLNVWAFNDTARSFYEAKGMKMLKIGMETIL